MRYRSLPLTLPFLVVLACGPELEPFDEVEAELQSTIPGKLSVLATHYGLPDAGLVLRSEAIGNSGNCTTWMISPQIALTAAHCGPINTMWMRRLSGGDATNWAEETFSCSSLVASSYYTEGPGQTSDFAAFWCAPNAAGELPGDKYGMIDLDPKILKAGDPLISVWMNDVVDQGLSWGTKLVSVGKVTNAAASCAYNCPTSYGNIGVDSDLPIQPGGSGSPSLDPVTLKAVVTPASVGNLGMRKSNSVWGLFNTMRSTFWPKGAVHPAIGGENLGTPNSIYNHASVSVGKLNVNGDRVLDLIAANEGGLAPRGVFLTRFDFKARDLLWSFPSAGVVPGVGAEFGAAGNDTMLIHYPNQDSFDAAALSGLALRGETTYRVTLRHDPGQVGSGRNQAFVAFRSKSGACKQALAMLPLDGHAGDRRDTVTLRTGKCPDYQLVYGIASDRASWAQSAATLREVAVLEEGATLDFDRFDAREGWHQTNGKHALMPTDGIGGFWAGEVRGSAAAWNEPLMNRALALKANTRYRLEFKTRTVSVDAAAPYVLVRSDAAFLEEGENNAFFADLPNQVSAGWVPRNYELTTGARADYRISFGERGLGRYYVDDVRLTDITPIRALVRISHGQPQDLTVYVGVGDPSQPIIKKKIFDRGVAPRSPLQLDVAFDEARAFFPPQPGAPFFVEVVDSAYGATGTLERFAVVGGGPEYVSPETGAITDFSVRHAAIGRVRATALIHHPAPAQLSVSVRCTGASVWSRSITGTHVVGQPSAVQLDPSEIRYAMDLSDGYRRCYPNGSANPRFELRVSDGVSGQTGTVADFGVSYAGRTLHKQNTNVIISDFATAIAFAE